LPGEETPKTIPGITGQIIETLTQAGLVVELTLPFIPKSTLHGPILKEGQSFAALSVFAPHFDRTKNNIEWDKDS